jgi:hypothetical protein
MNKLLLSSLLKLLFLVLCSPITYADKVIQMDENMMIEATKILHFQGEAGTVVEGLCKITSNPPYMYFAVNVVMDRDQEARQYLIVIHAITHDLITVGRK